MLDAEHDPNADLFGTFHYNSGDSEGSESYIYQGLQYTVTGVIQDKTHATIMDSYVLHGMRDRGKNEANFAILRKTKISAIILENLFFGI